MKKICFMFFAAVSSLALFAHTPLLTVEDNGDGTIYVQGGFSNGASAAGVKLYLTDKVSGERLWNGEFPDVGEINLQIPNVPYTVTFDAGPGHVVVKDGPEPQGGFGSAGAAAAPSEPVSSGETQTQSAPAALPAGGTGWIPMDTVSAIPAVGPSFTAIAALCLGVINLLLVMFLFKKVKK